MSSKCLSPPYTSFGAGLRTRIWFCAISSTSPQGGWSLVFKGALFIGLQLVKEIRKPPVLDQRLTNDTQQPNKNKRRQTSSNTTLIIRFFGVSGEGVPLITVWLEVRVLPGPPPFNSRFDFAIFFGRIVKLD